MSSASAPLVQLCLKPGELLISREPYEITTVLGSCVAVTMFNRRFGLAAICHAMLPHPFPGGCDDQAEAQTYKYVINVLPEMARAFRRTGILPNEVEVKMFGGANVIGHGDDRASQGIGSDNVRLARRLIGREGLKIKASNVGGHTGRKILFNTVTGQVFHKHLHG